MGLMLVEHRLQPAPFRLPERPVLVQLLRVPGDPGPVVVVEGQHIAGLRLAAHPGEPVHDVPEPVQRPVPAKPLHLGRHTGAAVPCAFEIHAVPAPAPLAEEGLRRFRQHLREPGERPVALLVGDREIRAPAPALLALVFPECPSGA